MTLANKEERMHHAQKKKATAQGYVKVCEANLIRARRKVMEADIELSAARQEFADYCQGIKRERA